MSAKEFAMGFRIEHPQSLIDELQYGAEAAQRDVLRGDSSDGAWQALPV